MPVSKMKIGAAVVTAVLLIIGLVMLFSGKDRVVRTGRASGETSIGTTPSSTPEARNDESMTQRRERREAEGQRWPVRFGSRQARQRVLSRIIATAAKSGSNADDADEDVGVLDKAYIREAIDVSRQELAQCYASALKTNPAFRKGGRLRVKFRVVADAQLGGLVQDVVLPEEMGHLEGDGFRQCLTDTFYDLSFPPPEKGGALSVTFPLTFRAEDE